MRKAPPRFRLVFMRIPRSVPSNRQFSARIWFIPPAVSLPRTIPPCPLCTVQPLTVTLLQGIPAFIPDSPAPDFITIASSPTFILQFFTVTFVHESISMPSVFGAFEAGFSTVISEIMKFLQ